MRPIQPNAFQYLLPQLVQSGANTQTSGSNGWTPGGGFSLQIPDNTVIGGNPRGLGAVDLQTQRTAATQVASGSRSFVAGSNNTVSGDFSAALGNGNFVSANGSFAIGNNNTVNAAFSFATGSSSAAIGFYSSALGVSTASSSYATAMGQSTASSTYAFAAGQATASGVSVALGNATASGAYACAMGGGSNASGNYSFACGYASTPQLGKFAYSGGPLGNLGDVQTGMMVLAINTTTNTTAVLTSSGGSAASFNQLIASSNKVIAFTGELIGKQSGSANIAAYTITGTLVNNAGTVTMPTGTLTAIGTDSIGLDTAPSLAADNTNKGLTVTSGAKTTTNIRWVCTLRSTENLYA